MGDRCYYYAVFKYYHSNITTYFLNKFADPFLVTHLAILHALIDWFHWLIEKNGVCKLVKKTLSYVMRTFVDFAVVVSHNFAKWALKRGLLQYFVELFLHIFQHFAVECCGDRKIHRDDLMFLELFGKLINLLFLSSCNYARSWVNAGDLHFVFFDLMHQNFLFLGLVLDDEHSVGRSCVFLHQRPSLVHQF